MPQTLVLGAGMVGVGTALALQERGHQTILLDRRDPGEETSYGNAGIIQTEAAEPYAMPRKLATLWSILAGRTNDVAWHLRAMPEYMRPLAEYYFHSAPPRHHVISQTYQALTRRATDDHAPLIAASGAQDLIRKDGYLQIYRSPGVLEQALRDTERLRREYGVPFEALDSQALARAEPDMRQPLAGAIHWTSPWTCTSPGGLTKAYADLFQARGGKIVRGDGMSLAPQASGWVCQSEDGVIQAENVVVALGPWSTKLIERFGYSVPLFRKRGYHQHFQKVAGPRMAMLDAENGTCICPMDAGVRLTTGAELTGFDAPIHRAQIERSTAGARSLFDLGPAVEPQPWFGHRPCLPDMRPLVGKAPRHPGLWFNFGHGHQGFTLGPTTGILLADLMTGGPVPDLMKQLGYRWN
jgi:D-amino-acid dehydrogenase